VPLRFVRCDRTVGTLRTEATELAARCSRSCCCCCCWCCGATAQLEKLWLVTGSSRSAESTDGVARGGLVCDCVADRILMRLSTCWRDAGLRSLCGGCCCGVALVPPLKYSGSQLCAVCEGDSGGGRQKELLLCCGLTMPGCDGASAALMLYEGGVRARDGVAKVSWGFIAPGRCRVTIEEILGVWRKSSRGV
jgi:hypothetical protein